MTAGTYHVGVSPSMRSEYVQIGWHAYCERCKWRSGDHDLEFATEMAKGHVCSEHEAAT